MIPNPCVACFGAFGEKPANWRSYLSGNAVPVKPSTTCSLHWIEFQNLGHFRIFLVDLFQIVFNFFFNVA